MPRFHILVTTDFSDASLRALDAAGALAGKLGGRITLLNVHEDVPAIPHGAPLAPAQHDPSSAGRRSAAEARLRQLCTNMPSSVQVDCVVADGERVTTAIAEQAERLGADLLVIASCGWNAATGLLMGSTTELLLRHAKLPVLVIPGCGDTKRLVLS